jgi:hypothetical protein
MSVLLIAAMVASAATGYVVILKNGHKLRAKEPLQIDGRNAIITLSTGTVTSFPLDQIDLVATERYNQQGLGDAIEIEELRTGDEAIPTPTPRRSLGHFASINTLSETELGSTVSPTPTPTPGIRLQSIGYHEPRITRAFTEILDQNRLYLYKTSAGTQHDFFFLQAVTDDTSEVFQTLRLITEAYAVICQRHTELAPAAVELEMVSTAGKPAGTFRITPTLATELTSGKVTIEQFYVKNVIF